MIEEELDVNALTENDVVLDDILNVDDVQGGESQSSQVVENQPQSYEEKATYSEDNTASYEENDNSNIVDDVLENEVAESKQEFVSSPKMNSVVSDNVYVANIESSGNSGCLRWYSGNLSDNVYEFGKNSQSANFSGSADCSAIHINVGYDTYGWSVQFADGTVMNLYDVKEYQIRNGKLPDSSGKVVFGQKVLSFSNVEKIIVYERVRYFSYGI